MILKESDLSIIQWRIYVKGKSEMKNLYCRATESPFCAEQNGEIRFCVGYFIYKIRGIKRMRVQKPL